MKLCLFGGSFDPVHNGHVNMAQEAIRRCGLDELHFLPAAESPFKPDNSFLFRADQRLALLRSATAGMERIRISEDDLRLPPPSWSWRLVELYRRRHPDSELYWLMGTDQWSELHRWARPDYLAEQLHFIVCHRGEPAQPRAGFRSTMIPLALPESATELRRCLRQHLPLPEGWMPPATAALARSFCEEQAR
ncbi:MAG: nicotinate-nicotinamide nucleotide adenylyltransferase [Akkermansia sp.]